VEDFEVEYRHRIRFDMNYDTKVSLNYYLYNQLELLIHKKYKGKCINILNKIHCLMKT